MVWCSLLSGFLQIGDAEEGLSFYLVFLSEGNEPEPFNFSRVFCLCSNLEHGWLGT